MLIDYLTGSRADFGLMERCLRTLDAAPDFTCRIVVTAQHLLAHYGMSLRDIEASGLEIAARVPVELSGTDGAEMAIAMAAELAELTRFWSCSRPDAVLVLGDRGEMLAASLAAVHLGIPVIHVGGGERSGTLDESFRHAITKLAHLHLCSTQSAADRIVRMGETPAMVHVIGAPGLVGIVDDTGPPVDFAERYGLPVGKPAALVVFHPVVQEADVADNQIRTVIETLRANGYAQLVLRPNSDAGGSAIDRYLDEAMTCEDICVVDHLHRSDYLTAMRDADLLVGNSSSGIIESASLRTACVNLGSRQNARERNPNTFDCPVIEPDSIASALAAAQAHVPDGTNVYGDGMADVRMLEILRSAPLEPAVLAKENAY